MTLLEALHSMGSRITDPSLGIDLEDWAQPTLELSKKNENGSTSETWHGWGEHRPIAVLPWHRRMNPSCHRDAVSSIWNTGYAWRSDAAFASNVARLPTWMLWRMLGEAPKEEDGFLIGHGISSHVYRMQDGTERTVLPRELLRCFLESCCGMDAQTKAVIAVPNTLDEWAQEEVLACSPWQSTRLLWRPVAAAIAAGDTLAEEEHIRLDGKTLAVCELRHDCVTACLVRLRRVVRKGRSFLVPVRHLPRSDNYRYSPTPALPLLIAEAILSLSGIEPDSDLVWHLACGTDFTWQTFREPAMDSLEMVIPSGDRWLPARAGREELRLIRDESMYQAGKASTHVCSTLPSGVRQGNASNSTAGAWLDQVGGVLADAIRKLKPDGFLLHGAGWSYAISGGDGREQELVQRAERAFFCSQPVVAWGEGLTDVPSSLVTRGCAIVGQRAQLGLPTYFDQLRQLDIIVQREEDIVPEVLIPGKEVDGDHTFRGEAMSGFYLLKGASSVKFYIRLQDAPTLRELTQDFGETDRRQPLSLVPSQRPARGHARVEVHNADLFQPGYALLDWRHMEPSKETLQSLNEKVPRSYPPELPEVRPDPALWTFFEPFVVRSLQTELRSSTRERPLLHALDQGFFQNCAAVRFDDDGDGLARVNVFGSSSTGGLPGNSPLVYPYLAKLRTDLNISRSAKNRLKLIRAMAWTYQGEQFAELREDLVRKLQEKPEFMEQEELTACGQLFRSHGEYEILMLAILDVFDKRDVIRMSWYVNSLRKLLTYRSNALERIDSDTCRFILWRSCRLLEHELSAHNLEVTFQEALVSILFLLRRRRYDDSYLVYENESVQSLLSKLSLEAHLFERYSGLRDDSDVIARMMALLGRAKEALFSVAKAHSGRRRAQMYLHRESLAKLVLKFIQGRGSLEDFVQVRDTIGA